MMFDGNERGAYARVHLRLVLYGQVLLQQAKGDEPDARDDQTIRKRIWTAREEAAAWEVQQQVVLLPARERIVVNAFYKAREAEYWHELEPERALTILADMCREINYRVRRWACEVQELPRTVRPHQVQPIRDGAIRELVPVLCLPRNTPPGPAARRCNLPLDNPTCGAV